MIMSYAQTAPSVAATYCSTAQCGWSHHSFCSLLDAAPLAAPPHRLPRSRCRACCADTWQECDSTAPDRWLHRGHRWRKRQSAGCDGTVPTIPISYFCVAPQMTTIHPTPAPRCADWVPESGAREAAVGLFLSQVVTVLRDTPKIRVKPRKEVRS